MSKNLEGMPPGDPHQCTSRTKTCRECGKRFSKGDKSWYCECGESRRCTKAALEKSNTCNSHGGGGGRPPSLKYKIASDLAEAFHVAKAHPELLSLTTEVAAMAARQDQLHKRLEQTDASMVVDDINAAIYEIEEGLIMRNNTRIAKGVVALRQAVDPANIERVIHDELKENYEITRRLIDTERKWATANKQTMEISLVLELLIMITRIAFRYIPSHMDRKHCADEIREFFPRRADLTIFE